MADGVTVDADKAVKIVAQMKIGNANETVTVDAEGTALDTKSSTLGTLIDNKLVEDLPIDGHNPVALAGLLPGVTDLNAPATNTSDRGGPTYSVSGSRNTQNLMLFDGLMWNNLFFNTGINYPPPHALQEISVLLNNFKAQYGRNAGSVFNVVTKSGSNQHSRRGVGLLSEPGVQCGGLFDACEPEGHQQPVWRDGDGADQD